MEVSRQLCSCFLLLLVLFVLSVKSDNSIEKVNSTEIDSDQVGNNTRTSRRMMNEVPLLIIRPMQEQKRTIFIMDHKHHKKHIAQNHMPMNSHSEFYVKEGEIFSLEKMLPFFGIDTKRGYKSNIKKGNMNHFLSSSNYNKPTASKLEQHPKYTNNNNNINNNKKPHYTKPDHQFLINPIPVNYPNMIQTSATYVNPIENKITPTTIRPQQQNKEQQQQHQLDVKSYKQDIIYHGNSVNYPNMIQTSATYVNPPEIYYNHHNDIIVGHQMGDKIKPPPTMKKEYFNNKQQQHQQHQPQQQQQQLHLQLRPFVHTNFYVPKTLDYAENRNKQQQLHYQQKEQLQFQPFAQSKHQMHINLKPKASALRQNPQIEYFFPQDQNYADININTDMEKSVKMAAEQQHESIPISKFYSSVKYQKPEPVEMENKYFETSSTKQFEVQSEIKVKNTEVQMNPLAELSQGYVQDVKMELKNEIQVDGKSSLRPQASKYTAEASERYETEVKPSFGIIVEDEGTTTENFPTTTTKSRNRKVRKRNRKSSTTTLIPDDETVEIITEKNQFKMKSDTTTINPFSCERGCIKKLTSKDYDPVCGSDGKTYYTKSKLRCAQTCRRDDLTIKSFGVCGKSPEPIVDIKYNY